MHDEVLARVRGELERLNLDAYIAYTPSNFFYVTRFQSFFLSSFWRWLGTTLAVVPTDPTLAPAMVVHDLEELSARAASPIADVRSYPIWSEARDLDIITGETPTPADFTRPAQYDPQRIYDLVAEILAERGLAHGRIGTDLRYIQHDSFERLRESCPGCTFVDMTDVMYRLRCVKLPAEVEILRRAAMLFEAGVNYAVAEIREGMRSTDVRNLYEMGVLRAVIADPTMSNYQYSWGVVTVGKGVKVGLGDQESLKRGDLVRFDCGVGVGGYVSDAGRTFVFGRPDTMQRRLYGALDSAHRRCREMLRPGTKISDIFHAAQGEVRSNGFPRYTRGHYGHSIGLDSFLEEPPYISADESTQLQPGMVLAVETPYWGDSIGCFQIEDMVVITEDGYENFNTLSYDLVEL